MKLLGGKQEDGERIHECMLREFYEEANVRLKISDLFYIGNYRARLKKRLKVRHYFFIPLTQEHMRHLRPDAEVKEYFEVCEVNDQLIQRLSMENGIALHTLRDMLFKYKS